MDSHYPFCRFSVRLTRTPNVTDDDRQTATERVRRAYDRIAPHYENYVGYVERHLLGDGRLWVCSRACGSTLELGIGTGRNLPYLPDDVRLVGLDLNTAMLAIAHQRAADLGRDVDLRVGDVQALDFRDGTFDSVVATMSLSSVPDSRRAVAEARRVLRPGGRFLALDFVRSPLLPVRAIQRVLEPLMVWRYGDHLLREPRDDLVAESFTIDQLERSKWGVVERVAARKPECIADLSVRSQPISLDA
jgi:ubiquinone/menaquinone biosynthesis C-methylase UbiE